jgi:hypothetical protein
MDISSKLILALWSYKLASLAAGLSSLFMGYKLFMSGVWGNAGSLDAKIESNAITLKHAAPGTFFVVLGSIIVCTTLIKGLEIEATLENINKFQTVDNASSSMLPNVPEKNAVDLPLKPPTQ